MKRYIKLVILVTLLFLIGSTVIFITTEGRKISVIENDVNKLRMLYNGFQNMLPYYGYGIKGDGVLKDGGCFPDKAKLLSDVQEKYPNAEVSWRYWAGTMELRGGTDAGKYFRADEPCDSPINIKAWNFLLCWNCRPDHKHVDKCYWTNVMGIVGPDTAFDVQLPEKLKGCENLIFIVSVKDSGVHWGQPGDIDVRNIPPHFREGIDGNGFYAMFFDGTIWFIRKDVPLDLLKKFFTVTEAKKMNRYDELIKYSKELYKAP
jgi:hypothetical protein